MCVCGSHKSSVNKDMVLKYVLRSFKMVVVHRAKLDQNRSAVLAHPLTCNAVSDPLNRLQEKRFSTDCALNLVAMVMHCALCVIQLGIEHPQFNVAQAHGSKYKEKVVERDRGVSRE